MTESMKRAPRRKDAKGGLTAAGRKYFRQKEGAHLRPGVKGKADTPDKMRRKGSFLRRHYANPRGPLIDANGRPTRLALQAHAWGEPVPKNEADARKLAEKGAKLLARYRAAKAKAENNTASAASRASPKKIARQYANRVNLSKKKLRH